MVEGPWGPRSPCPLFFSPGSPGGGVLIADPARGRTERKSGPSSLSGSIFSGQTKWRIGGIPDWSVSGVGVDYTRTFSTGVVGRDWQEARRSRKERGQGLWCVVAWWRSTGVGEGSWRPRSPCPLCRAAEVPTEWAWFELPERCSSARGWRGGVCGGEVEIGDDHRSGPLRPGMWWRTTRWRSGGPVVGHKGWKVLQVADVWSSVWWRGGGSMGSRSCTLRSFG